MFFFCFSQLTGKFGHLSRVSSKTIPLPSKASTIADLMAMMRKVVSGFQPLMGVGEDMTKVIRTIAFAATVDAARQGKHASRGLTLSLLRPGLVAVWN